MKMTRTILLTGFEPFGGEKTNPSWDVAQRLNGRKFREAQVYALRLQVNCPRAAEGIVRAIDEMRPLAVLGLGQAGGRPSLSLEKIAVNLADERPSRETEGGLDAKPVIEGGPDAYFSRLPLKRMMTTLRERQIPAAISLSAGVYVCNTVMYAALHALREQPEVPAGFIHLPFEAAQAVRRGGPSMSLDLMTAGIECAIEILAS
jgi:pyroglutamyl-peptidase